MNYYIKFIDINLCITENPTIKVTTTTQNHNLVLSTTTIAQEQTTTTKPGSTTSTAFPNQTNSTTTTFSPEQTTITKVVTAITNILSEQTTTTKLLTTSTQPTKLENISSKSKISLRWYALFISLTSEKVTIFNICNIVQYTSNFDFQLWHEFCFRKLLTVTYVFPDLCHYKHINIQKYVIQNVMFNANVTQRSWEMFSSTQRHVWDYLFSTISILKTAMWT